jgi:superoxide dismutase, Fe-Mn family
MNFIYQYKVMIELFKSKSKIMKFDLPNLPFKIDALEPSISQKTIEFHYRKHHMTYVKNLNDLITGTKFEKLDLETIIKVAEGSIFHNAAQVWNHSFYFSCLNPGKKFVLKDPFVYFVNRSFGSFLSFKDTFIKSSVTLFGSGWTWLVLNPNGLLEIIQESNAGNPMRKGLIPLLVCDVWEHAYYLDYQDRRADYVEAFWNLVNWELIGKRFIESIR